MFRIELYNQYGLKVQILSCNLKVCTSIGAKVYELQLFNSQPAVFQGSKCNLKIDSKGCKKKLQGCMDSSLD